MQTRVSIGWASGLGWAGFAGFMITSVVQSLESGAQLMHGPSKLPGLIAIGMLALTNAGRQAQARGLPGASFLQNLEAEVPQALQELRAASPAIDQQAIDRRAAERAAGGV